jgi:hypothetical protein
MLGAALVIVRVLSVLFFVGLAGSAVVVLISFVEDFKELFAPDEPETAPRSAPPLAASGSAQNAR